MLDPGESVGQSLEVIDGTGQFLLPGLWDMHVHIVYEAQLIQQMPDLFLDYGVTSVRDTGALLANIQPELARWRARRGRSRYLFQWSVAGWSIGGLRR